MQSRKISTVKKGFSLIELLVVLGMLAVIGGFSLAISMENYRGSAFDDEQALLIAALQKARSEGLSGVCIGGSCTAGQSHGVHIDPAQLVIFQGTNYSESDANNEYLPLQNNALMFSGMSDVVFAEFSGDASPAGAIVLSDTDRVSTTTIGEEGQIMLDN